MKSTKTINMASEDDIKGAETSRRLSLSRYLPCKYNYHFRSKLLYHNHNSRNSEDSEIVSHLQEKMFLCSRNRWWMAKWLIGKHTHTCAHPCVHEYGLKTWGLWVRHKADYYSRNYNSRNIYCIVFPVLCAYRSISGWYMNIRWGHIRGEEPQYL